MTELSFSSKTPIDRFAGRFVCRKHIGGLCGARLWAQRKPLKRQSQSQNDLNRLLVWAARTAS